MQRFSNIYGCQTWHPAMRRVVGGMLGRTSLGLLFIDLVYLPVELRGRQIGTHMLQMAEEEAVRRGCRGAVLYTISFQAPGFYQRHGWREFGRIPCDPPGTSRVFISAIQACRACGGCDACTLR
jgi:GNAT superfamily N-acetyltransferase